MKRNLFLLLFAIATLSTFAQTTSEHLTFKGVPIDGTLTEFVSKLKQKGLTHIGTEDGTAILKGDFAAYKNCTVAAIALKQKNLVAKVGVMFPSLETWSSLSNNYFSLKEMLTKKYGEPEVCIEEFQTKIMPNDDNSKIHEVRMNRCKYVTGYTTEKGDIELQIKGSFTDGCYVTLIYFDKINGEVIEAEAMEDL